MSLGTGGTECLMVRRVRGESNAHSLVTPTDHPLHKVDGSSQRDTRYVACCTTIGMLPLCSV